MNKQQSGQLGERRAEQALLSKGYSLVARNYRALKCEIDLIMRDKANNAIVFIEVKSRSTLAHGGGAEAVTRGKQRNIIKAASFYLMKNDLFNENIRFDVVEVDLLSAQVNHIMNAFY